MATIVEPIRKSIVVPLTRAEAYELFTSGISIWWPFNGHSVSKERARRAVVESRIPGRVYEIRDDGEEFDWGRVTRWSPPKRFGMTWHPGRSPQSEQPLEIQFLADDNGTRVELEQRDWEVLGERAVAMRNEYDAGWDVILNAFREAAERRKREPK